MKSKLITSLVFISFFLSSPYAQVTIAIQPFGTFDTSLIAIVTPDIVKRFDSAAVIILPAQKLPQAAYYKPRNRYRAEILLEKLDSTNNNRYAKILGLTNKDISTTKGEVYDWGIFGLGSMGAAPCVVSTFRMKKNSAPELFTQRLRKVVVHELGHTFGLVHCDWPLCVMLDYRGTIASLDGTGFGFCSKCQARLRGYIEKIKSPAGL
jgi:archaemetzincin